MIQRLLPGLSCAPRRWSQDERFVYQATLDAIDFIQGHAKGDTEA